MRSRLTLGLSIGLSVALSGAPALAVPEISEIEGEFSQGAEILAYGGDFGVKVPAAPLIYDNFEDGVVGLSLKGQSEGGWYLMPDTSVSFRAKYNADRQRVPGELVAIQDYSQGYNATIGLWQVDVSKLYFSGWCYRDDYAGTALNTTNRKLSGNFGHADGGNYGYPQARVGTDGANNTGEHHYVTNASGQALFSDYYHPSADLWDRWFRLERYMDMGTLNGNNGLTWIAHDLNIDSQFSGSLWTGGERFDYFIIGQYFRKDNGATLKMYWGEMYVDVTQARIELGDAPVFAQCSHREIQIPTGWSESSVTFTANLGTFDGTGNAYLFVVDSEGQASSGVLVAFGDGGTPALGPGMPGQPQRIQ